MYKVFRSVVIATRREQLDILDSLAFLTCGYNMKCLPVVDIRSTFLPGKENWESAAEKLTDALHDTGFVYLTGHGIDLELV